MKSTGIVVYIVNWAVRYLPISMLQNEQLSFCVLSVLDAGNGNNTRSVEAGLKWFYTVFTNAKHRRHGNYHKILHTEDGILSSLQYSFCTVSDWNSHVLQMVCAKEYFITYFIHTMCIQRDIHHHVGWVCFLSVTNMCRQLSTASVNRLHHDNQWTFKMAAPISTFKTWHLVIDKNITHIFCTRWKMLSFKE